LLEGAIKIAMRRIIVIRIIIPIIDVATPPIISSIDAMIAPKENFPLRARFEKIPEIPTRTPNERTGEKSSVDVRRNLMERKIFR
jgi:hypothetical protein